MLYLHSFYPEQPDLDWRNPEVIDAMQGVLRFWLERGASGYRVDAIDRLLKDAELRDDPPASEPFGLPLRPDEAALALSMSRNAPDTGEALAKIRAATGDAFSWEKVYLPAARWQPYLESLDACFAFELLHANWDATALHHAIEASARMPTAAWVMSSHDFGRLHPPRGAENARAAAVLLLCASAPPSCTRATRSASATVRPAKARFDRAGATAFATRCSRSRIGRGLHDQRPAAPGDRPERAQRPRPAPADPGSMLTLVQDLIALRRQLSPEFELLGAEPGLLAFGAVALVAINSTAERLAVREAGGALLESERGALRDGTLGARGDGCGTRLACAHQRCPAWC